MAKQIQKTLFKSTVKPSVPMSKSEKSERINKYFKSKQRYDKEAFLEGIFSIRLQNSRTITEYGYSKQFNPSNKAEYNAAVENAFHNALAKVSYREGWSFDGSEDVMELDNSEVEEAELVDYFLYYLKFSDTNVIRYQGSRKDGSNYNMVRFQENGKFVKGGGIEDKDKSMFETLKVFDLREQSFSKQRAKVSKGAIGITFKEALEQAKGKPEREQKRIIALALGKELKGDRKGKSMSKKRRDAIEKFK